MSNCIILQHATSVLDLQGCAGWICHLIKSTSVGCRLNAIKEQQHIFTMEDELKADALQKVKAFEGTMVYPLT